MATTKKSSGAKPDASSPFAERTAPLSTETKDQIHVFGDGFVCDTEPRGKASPGGASPFELVINAPGGFIPLWAKGTTLRWRLQDEAFKHFAKPAAAKAEVRKLLGECLLKWGDAAPIKFSEQDENWDFEIAPRPADNCNSVGCVLARAFFPDSGRHTLELFPELFKQTRDEQVETFIHEIGHIFGLRHFFADIEEKKWPSEIFGTHDRFTIMNYGSDSKLTEIDKSDLKKLYQSAWAGDLKEVNGTKIKFVQPFHTLAGPENVVSINTGSPFATGPFAQPIAAYVRQ